MTLGAIASVIETALNLLSLGLFAAMAHLLVTGLLPDGAQSSGTEHGSFQISAQNILSIASNAIDSISGEHGIIVIFSFVALLYLISVIISRFLRFSSTYFLLKSKFIFIQAVVGDFFRHVMKMSLDFFYHRKVGDLTTRMGSDTYGLAGAIFDVVRILVTSLPLFLFYWALLILTSWQLTLGVVLIVAVKAVAANLLGERIQRKIFDIGGAGGATSSKLTEVFSNIAVIKAFGKERFEHAAFDGILRQFSQLRRQRQMLDHLNTLIQTVLQSIAVVAVASFGATMLLKNMIEPGPLMIYFFAANRSQEPTRQLIGFLMGIHKVRGFAVRVLEIYRNQPSVKDGEVETSGFSATLRFDNVTFSYGTEESSLKDIDLTVNKGEVVAVVGPSGGGKTSLLNLLLRFYDPGKGSILLDGRDITECTLNSYRRLFGMVTQEPILFNATIRENIAYGAEVGEVTDGDIVRAAQIANVDEFTDRMVDGLDTFIGDRGVRLSGGQRQRVTLARAILRNPPILVLDEATSSLDSHSERLIQESIDRYLDGRTAVIVAHRLSTIRKADRIIVLEGGRIAEHGSHEDLLARRGAYFHLHEAQAEVESSG